MNRVAMALALTAASASAHADLTGFAQLRHVQRARALADCTPVRGCSAMSQEALGELLYERRSSNGLSGAARVEGYHDTAISNGRIQLREGFVDWTPNKAVSARLGRQIMTWGVSDYLYANDLFPKNYDAFFTGGGFDRMKEPVDGGKLTIASAGPDVELVASRPRADRLPNADRFAAMAGARAALAETSSKHRVDLAAKASGHIGGWDLAAYAARFSAREERLFAAADGLHSERPRVTHAGLSVTGNFAGGVTWSELAVRHVDGDSRGVVSRLFLGSATKWIGGYSREIGADVNVSAQLQLEAPNSGSRYRASLAAGVRPVRPITTTLHLRLQSRWKNQTLGAGAQVFAGSEGDAHFNPFVSWSPADGWAIEGGANLFSGRPDTRYGAFKDDSNVYALGRFSF
jgi:hypothetical protein